MATLSALSAVCALFPRPRAAAGTRWDVASDYWLMVLHKRLVGGGVLTSSGDDASQALVYAHCGAAGNGSTVIMAVNPSAQAVTLMIGNEDEVAIPTTPRLEYVLTAPDGNLSSIAPLLNGDTLLRINDDGSLPPLLPTWVPGFGSETITLPPRSQAFFVLVAAGTPACVVGN